MKEDKLIIGLIIEDMHTDFAREMIHSAISAIPKKKDVHIIVLAGKHDESDDPDDITHRYKSVYNTVYKLEEMYRFDGLIVAVGGMKSSGDILSEITRMANYSGIPKVYAAAPKGRIPYVNYDNEMGIREAIDYLVNVNGYSQVCMLGGRPDNADAVERKNAYIRALKDNHVIFKDSMFEETDMSVNSQEAANRLLAHNPGVQAIFCVNDATAVGLYDVMKSRGLMPGRDILVFGFDNTRMAGEMSPTLASIGAYGGRMGQIAMEMILGIIDGKTADSVIIPTKLYGKESLNYEMYDFAISEIIRGNEDFLYRVFDECFYLYNNEDIHREDINLKRLFFEINSRILAASRMRYMSVEEFEEIGRMVDIFFKNGAMGFTDAHRFIQSVEKFQTDLNRSQKSVSASVLINRLFLRMKDMAILSLSDQRIRENLAYSKGRHDVLEFLIELSDDRLSADEMKQRAVQNFHKLGFKNAALFLYDHSVTFDINNGVVLPENIRLRCIVRDGDVYSIPEERQECMMNVLFDKDEILTGINGHVVIPVFYSKYIYGYLICGFGTGDEGRGEYIAGQLGRAFYSQEW